MTVSTAGAALTDSSTPVTFSVNANANSLSPGIHTEVIKFTNTTNGHGTATRRVTLTVSPPANSLTVRPDIPATVTGHAGGPFPSFSYDVSATSGTVPYQISGLPIWLTVSRTTGTATTTATPITFTFNENASALSPAVHEATIQFKKRTVPVVVEQNTPANGSASSTYGDTTRTVRLTVTAPPLTVTLHPSDQTVAAGGMASFSAAANGNPTPSVKWQRSIGGGAFQDIAGATSATYTFSATAVQNGHRFRAVFSNTAGSVETNAALLTVTPTVNLAGASTIYVAAGALDSGDVANAGQASVVKCSNVSGQPVAIRVLVLRHNAQPAGSVAFALAHGADQTVATHGVASASELMLNTGAFGPGTILVESTQLAVFCTAEIVDAAAIQNSVPLHMARINSLAGTEE